MACSKVTNMIFSKIGSDVILLHLTRYVLKTFPNVFSKTCFTQCFLKGRLTHAFQDSLFFKYIIDVAISNTFGTLVAFFHR